MNKCKGSAFKICQNVDFSASFWWDIEKKLYWWWKANSEHYYIARGIMSTLSIVALFMTHSFNRQCSLCLCQHPLSANVSANFKWTGFKINMNLNRDVLRNGQAHRLQEVKESFACFFDNKGFGPNSKFLYKAELSRKLDSNYVP